MFLQSLVHQDLFPALIFGYWASINPSRAWRAQFWTGAILSSSTGASTKQAEKEGRKDCLWQLKI